MTRSLWALPRAALLLLAVAASDSNQRACPTRDNTLISVGGGVKAELKISNEISADVEVEWVDMSGKIIAADYVQPGELSFEGTFVGHVFLFYAKDEHGEKILLLQHQVSSASGVVSLTPCGGKFEAYKERQSHRHEEFVKLTSVATAPCEPADDSSKWSCSRVLQKEDLAERDPEHYGLPVGHNRDGKQSHDMVDTSYVHQIPEIPRVTRTGPGFMRMKFTPKMLEAISWWHSYSGEHGEGPREYIPGGYTNSNTVELNILSLDHHRHIHAKLTSEMKDILEWWTGLELQHTATYGVRTYHRGSVLIDHVDREDTHIASAVLQLSQSLDKDGGWPLEVMLPNDQIGEVYLQPGEMVLYEGAWLRHGRPMRLRGDNFSNVFCHFSPLGWKERKKTKNKYYGVPEDRLTTLADHGIRTSDQYGFLARKPDL